MLRLGHKAYELAFEYPFTIAKGRKTHQPTLLVSLGIGPHWGLGEATAIGYYNVSIEEMIVLLEKNRATIERYALTSPERFWHFLHHLLPGHNFLISALDCAGWDLWAKLKGKPLYQMLGLQWQNIPATDYTIGIMPADEIADRVRQKSYPIYKLKVGGPEDLASLIALRAAAPHAKIRIDANEGWDLATAKELVPELKKLQIELIEQPLDREDHEGMQALRSVCDIPLIADEACHEEKDLASCLALFDGINIKLSKCGGITPALRMIDIIKKANKAVMLGSMSESMVGAAALAHLLPLADYADIDGPLLLQEQVGKGLTYDNEGNINVADQAGIGITI
jgi:L-alanine-DL-glutamate epimerase-like enolase superfamily enzyme